MDPIDLIFYRERASQPAKNETKEKRWKEEGGERDTQLVHVNEATAV